MKRRGIPASPFTELSLYGFPVYYARLYTDQSVSVFILVGGKTQCLAPGRREVEKETLVGNQGDREHQK